MYLNYYFFLKISLSFFTPLQVSIEKGIYVVYHWVCVLLIIEGRTNDDM